MINVFNKHSFLYLLFPLDYYTWLFGDFNKIWFIKLFNTYLGK